MDALASILEEEFALAFEVKDEKALRRSLALLIGGMVAKGEYEKEQNSLSSDVKLLTVEMKEGFKRMDERFEVHDKRFDRITSLLSLGFVTVTVLITVFQFLGS